MQKRLCLVIMSFLLSGCLWEQTDNNPEYLVLDDSEYPYSGLPRLVIETNDFRQIRDTETEIPALLQIYGERAPETEPLELRIRGRGNAGFGMPKYNLKLEFTDKQDLCGMPASRDFALISNHADKSMLRNYISFKIAEWLNLGYVPRNAFVELYLNREYKGVYLLSETIKVAKTRVNIPKDGSAFLLEVDKKNRAGEQIIKTTNGLPLRVRYPKEASEEQLLMLTEHLNAWETYMRVPMNFDSLQQNWLDVDRYVKYYWIEEFAKNIDNNFNTSVYFTWQKDGLIEFGPIWDFDLSFGDYKMLDPHGWYLRWNVWNVWLFKNYQFKKYAVDFWKENREIFISTLDSIDVYKKYLQKAARNNFKRWPILDATILWEYSQSFTDYNEAVEYLKTWISERIKWIDSNI